MATKGTTPHRILQAMEKAERTQKWTAEKAGIAPSTFRRKLHGGADFTISEVQRIARALNCPAWTLLPDSFEVEAVAA